MSFVLKKTYYSSPTYEWNLPAGWTCPGARTCLVKASKETGKMRNESTEYRCYAAMAERFPGVRGHRWANFEMAKRGELPELPKTAKRVRIHASGDFFNQRYFDRWMEYARQYPEVEFWAYTKSLVYWVKRLHDIPDNLVLTASYGGKQDHLIEEHGLKNVIVIKRPEGYTSATRLARPVDTNDDLARLPRVNFYLLDNYT